MKKIVTIALALGLSAGAASAGGYSAPVIEPAPVVVTGAATTNTGLLVPALLGVALIAAIAADSDSDSDTTTE